MATPQTNVVGIFEDRTQADQAVTELRRAGFREDHIMVAEHGRGQTDAGPAPKAAPGDVAEVRRTLVTVRADHRHAEALTLLQRHGAHDIQRVAR